MLYDADTIVTRSGSQVCT